MKENDLQKNMPCFFFILLLFFLIEAKGTGLVRTYNELSSGKALLLHPIQNIEDAQCVDGWGCNGEMVVGWTSDPCRQPPRTAPLSSRPSLEVQKALIEVFSSLLPAPSPGLWLGASRQLMFGA